jgi:RNA polymerase sigma-70 factor (ECF subfamily)
MKPEVIVSSGVEQGRSRLERMYRTHARDVLAYALRRVPHDDSYEVVAETFLTAWRRLDAVPDNALPWLLGVARKVISNQRRSAARRAALTSKLGRVIGYAPGHESDPATQGEIREVVLRAMSTLSEREREALMLSFWDDLDPATAAQVAGCSTRAFSARTYRARRRLAMLLADVEEDSAREGRLPRPTHKEAKER